MMALIVLALLSSSLVWPLGVLGQEDSRAATLGSEGKVSIVEGTGGVGGGAQSRTIYSARHISPHRMMHFGKRPLVRDAPVILSPQAFDLYQPDEYPYLLHIELEQGQMLQALPEESQQTAKNLIYSYDYPQQFEIRQNPQRQQHQLQQPQQQAQSPLVEQRLAKLISEAASGAFAQTDGDGEKAHSASNENENDNEQQNNNIKVGTRSSSMQSNARGNTMNLPKGFISNMLYGRSSSSAMPSFVPFNKKAEPKDNFFMHFGRK